MTGVVEIRSYTLKHGTAARFSQVMREQSLPLLRTAGMDVVAFNQSLHDANVFVLMRVYRDLEHLTCSQDQFYESDAWRDGPRETVLACIEHYMSVVIQADARLLAALRQHPSAQT